MVEYRTMHHDRCRLCMVLSCPFQVADLPRHCDVAG